MSQKLLMFLKETDCKILIKYDGERSKNKYTIKLLYNDLRKGFLGRDTDAPLDVMAAIFEKQEIYSTEEAQNLFNTLFKEFIEAQQLKFGNECIVSIMLQKKDSLVEYNFFLQTNKSIKRASAFDIEELLTKISE